MIHEVAESVADSKSGQERGEANEPAWLKNWFMMIGHSPLLSINIAPIG